MCEKTPLRSHDHTHPFHPFKSLTSEHPTMSEALETTDHSPLRDSSVNGGLSVIKDLFKATHVE